LSIFCEAVENSSRADESGGKRVLIRGDAVADVGILGLGENSFFNHVVFVVERARGDDFVSLGGRDAREAEQVALGGGVQVDGGMGVVLEAVAHALGGGCDLMGGFVRCLIEFAAGFFDDRLGTLGGFGDFVAGFGVALALVLRVRTATCEHQQRRNETSGTEEGT
jgi:hypothetical protein